MSFAALSNEIILMISSYLNDPDSVYSLARVNHRFWVLMGPSIYNNSFQIGVGMRRQALAGILQSFRISNATKLAIAKGAMKGFMPVKLLVSDAIRRSTERTLLHIAVGTGYIPLVRLFVNAGANINRVTSKYGSPLKFAIRSCDAKMVAWLLRHQHITLHGGSEALLTVAVRSASISVTRALIKHAIDNNTKTICDSRTLPLAVMRQNEKMVKLLLTYDKINFNGDLSLQCDCKKTLKTPLMLACARDSLEILKLLCDGDIVGMDREQYGSPNKSGTPRNTDDGDLVEIASGSSQFMNLEFLHRFMRQRQSEDAAFRRACRSGDMVGAADIVDAAQLGRWRMKLWLKAVRCSGLGLLLCARTLL